MLAKQNWNFFLPIGREVFSLLPRSRASECCRKVNATAMSVHSSFPPAFIANHDVRWSRMCFCLTGVESAGCCLSHRLACSLEERQWRKDKSSVLCKHLLRAENRLVCYLCWFNHKPKAQQHTNPVKEISSIPSSLSQLLMTELLHQNHNAVRTICEFPTT